MTTPRSHAPRKIPQGTHRYNATHTGETTSGMGGSRNSKTTERLSGDTVGSHCRPRHRESVPHITKTHSRSSRRRDSSEPYPHLMRVRHSRGTPASRSSSSHHPPAPVACSRLHAHRNPPCRLLSAPHLVVQGYVIGLSRRSPCHPEPSIQEKAIFDTRYWGVIKLPRAGFQPAAGVKMLAILTVNHYI